MTAAFTYSDKKDERFPEHCMASMLAWGDIAKTFASDEIGSSELRADGSVKLTYTFFEITLMPDGTFSGKRLTGQNVSQENSQA